MERPTMLFVILGTSIATAPLIVGLMIGADTDSIFVWTVMGSLPILIGMMALRIRGRSVVAWWLLSLLVMSLFYAATAVYLLRVGERTLNSGLGGALLLGAIPLVVIVALLPRLPPPKRSS
jgi:peptidoglycan/LPS O-acetylase OafA/YrhL